MPKTYAQTVTALAREYGPAHRDGMIAREDLDVMTKKLMDAAHPVGISAEDATSDLFDEMEAPPVQA